MSSPWADDLAFAIQHSCPADLLRSFEHLGRIAIDSLAGHGLDLNYGHGKAEVMMSLKGRGAVALRRTSFS